MNGIHRHGIPLLQREEEQIHASPLLKRRRQRPRHGQVADVAERDEQLDLHRVDAELLRIGHERVRKRLALPRALDRCAIGAARDVGLQRAWQRPVAHAHLRHALASRRVEGGEAGERAHAARGEQADALQRRERRRERMQIADRRPVASACASGLSVHLAALLCVGVRSNSHDEEATQKGAR
jgi:hypothetical protein